MHKGSIALIVFSPFEENCISTFSSIYMTKLKYSHSPDISGKFRKLSQAIILRERLKVLFENLKVKCNSITQFAVLMHRTIRMDFAFLMHHELHLQKGIFPLHSVSYNEHFKYKRSSFT